MTHKALMQLLCSFAPEPLPRDLIIDHVKIIADKLWNNTDKAYQHVDKLLEGLSWVFNGSCRGGHI